MATRLTPPTGIPVYNLKTILRQPHLAEQLQERISRLSRALSVLCVLLTLIAATAQVTHVHDGNSNAADRDCSLCSVAHSSAVVAAAIQPIPPFVRTAVVGSLKPSLRSFLSVSCSYIRPPPSV
jgi:mannose/fructose/N-acetylgalactosamine-specific phosphotransferase system component IIC